MLEAKTNSRMDSKDSKTMATTIETTNAIETLRVNQALLQLNAAVAAEAAAQQQRRLRCTRPAPDRLQSSFDTLGHSEYALRTCTSAASRADHNAVVGFAIFESTFAAVDAATRAAGAAAVEPTSHDDFLVLRRLSHATRRLSPGGQPVARVRPQSLI